MTKCNDCIQAHQRGRRVCLHHSTVHAAKVQRHCDRQDWKQLEREGWDSPAELLADLDEMDAYKKEMEKQAVPEYIRAEAKKRGRQRGLEDGRAEDMLPKRERTERYLALKKRK